MAFVIVMVEWIYRFEESLLLQKQENEEIDIPSTLREQYGLYVMSYKPDVK